MPIAPQNTNISAQAHIAERSNPRKVDNSGQKICDNVQKWVAS